MGAAPRELVIVVGSPSLRSTLVARLGLAGETFRTMDGLDGARAALSSRRRTFLIVDGLTLPGGADGWDRALDGAGLDGPVMLLCSDAALLDAKSARVTAIDARRPGKAVVDDIISWCDTCPEE